MNGTGRLGSCTHSSLPASDGRRGLDQPAVAEAGVGAAVAVQVPGLLDQPGGGQAGGPATRWRPSGRCGRRGGAWPGADSRTISSRNSVIVDSKSITEWARSRSRRTADPRSPGDPTGPSAAAGPAVPLPAIAAKFAGVPISSSSYQPEMWSTGTLYLGDPVLVAQGLPPLVEGLMAAFLAPRLGAKAGGLIELDKRAVPVDRHPVDRLGVLQGASVGHPVPMDVHRTRQAGRVLHERVDGVTRTIIAASTGAGAAPSATGSAPGSFRRRWRPSHRTSLGRGPLDDIDTVDAVVAVGRELPVGVATARTSTQTAA